MIILNRSPAPTILRSSLQAPSSHLSGMTIQSGTVVKSGAETAVSVVAWKMGAVGHMDLFSSIQEGQASKGKTGAVLKE